MENTGRSKASEDKSTPQKPTRVRKIRFPSSPSKPQVAESTERYVDTSQRSNYTESNPYELSEPASYPRTNARPTAVTVIAILNFIGVVLVFFAWTQVLGIDRSLIDDEFTSSGVKLAYNIYLYGFPLAMILSIAIGVGLWQLKSWARITAIVFYWLGAGLTLCGMLISSNASLTNFVSTAVGVTCAIILSQRNVAEAFE